LLAPNTEERSNVTTKDVDIQLIGNVPFLWYLGHFVEIRYTCVEKRQKRDGRGNKVFLIRRAIGKGDEKSL